MPLEEAKNKSKKEQNKSIMQNIHELVHNSKKKRSHAQIVAASIHAAKGNK